MQPTRTKWWELMRRSRDSWPRYATPFGAGNTSVPESFTPAEDGVNVNSGAMTDCVMEIWKVKVK